MQKILIVDDDEDIGRGLEIDLTREGYKALRVTNGQAGIDSAIRNNPDLVLLDVAMPGVNGFDVCRELRQKGFEAPIIMLTAKSEEIDRVVGLEIGADDYVPKPFSLRELQARIRARLRRTAPASPDGLSRYCFDDVEIDFDKLRATRKNQELDLSPREFEILRLLIQNRGDVVTRDKLLDTVWGYDSFPTTRTVDNHIMKLRKKLEDDPANPKYLLSIYGEGYKFVG
jgi:two-component system alkaline phosphatase synthesis response regulator PhoP